MTWDEKRARSWILRKAADMLDAPLSPPPGLGPGLESLVAELVEYAVDDDPLSEDAFREALRIWAGLDADAVDAAAAEVRAPQARR